MEAIGDHLPKDPSLLHFQTGDVIQVIHNQHLQQTNGRFGFFCNRNWIFTQLVGGRRLSLRKVSFRGDFFSEIKSN